MSEIPKFEINSSKTIKSKKKFAYYLNDEKITLRKRFNIFGIFYIVNLFLILLNFWGFHHERIIETTLIALMIIMIIIFSLILNKLTKLKDKAFKYITHTYFLFLNIFNSIILVESAINKQDYSLPTQLYYFWMGYRFFAISLITKIFSRSSTVTIPTLFFELIYLIVRLNPKDEEIYKPILISILISLMYCYFFYLYDKFLTDDSQMKLYQKEDSYLFKKMLNMIPQALMIIDKDDYLFYSNLNAKNLIFSGSQIIKTKNKKIENFFKNLKIVIKEEDKEQLMTEKSPINTQKSKLFEDSHLENGNPTNRNLKETNGNLKETNDNGKITNYNQRNINEPYLFLPHDKNITGNYSIIPKSINLTKVFTRFI